MFHLKEKRIILTANIEFLGPLSKAKQPLPALARAKLDIHSSTNGCSTLDGNNTDMYIEYQARKIQLLIHSLYQTVSIKCAHYETLMYLAEIGSNHINMC